MKFWDTLRTKIRQKAFRKALRVIELSLIVATMLLPFGLTKVCLVLLRIIAKVLLWVAEEKKETLEEEHEPP